LTKVIKKIPILDDLASCEKVVSAI